MTDFATTQNCTISVRFEWTSGHRLANHPGRCAGLHGHNYVAKVDVCGPLNPTSGMVMDFDTLLSISRKWVMDHWDHCLLLAVDDDLGGVADSVADLNRSAGTNIVRLPLPPSAEVLATVLAEEVTTKLQAPFRLEA